MKKLDGMTFLVDRQEIARAINFEGYPVLRMEIGHPRPGWKEGQVYSGCTVRIRSERHHDIWYTCELDMYGDEQRDEYRSIPAYWDKIHLTSPGAMLKSDFGYHDVIKLYEEANTPWVEPNQEVIVIFDNSESQKCFIRKMKVTDRVNDFCSTIATIVNV